MYQDNVENVILEKNGRAFSYLPMIAVIWKQASE